MTTARQIMHVGVETISAQTSLAEAARRMRDRNVGALPVCDSDGNPVGMVTDRDIIIECIATGQDPRHATTGMLAGRKLIAVSGDTDVGDVLATMQTHRIRRLPVIDGNELVGIISEADLSRGLREQQVGEFVEAVCAP
ncbi:CBS domain-containing protein [Nocardia sp. CA2R105]|uniref:CBS domain-containing protein n=1 Tax=Nocardia coffeae TaxID=2873381 RepID=UPI001CA66DA0|nr:CBS domain-containing protein [Nocardia coffeae]MBY8857407.1 CBS domain-containing protein [Nocardia coffeae]